MILSNDGLVAFHYSSYGTFCVHLKSSIISTVVLSTTEIIEPLKQTLVCFFRTIVSEFNKIV